MGIFESKIEIYWNLLRFTEIFILLISKYWNLLNFTELYWIYRHFILLTFHFTDISILKFPIKFKILFHSFKIWVFTVLTVSVAIFLPEFCSYLIENKSDGVFWHRYSE